MLLKHVRQITLIIGVILHLSGYCQNIDSLLKVLPNLPRDTNKVNTLNTLAKSFEYSDPPRSLRFIKDAILLSENIGYKKGEAKGYLNKGNYYFHKADYNTALESYNYALLINKSIDNLNGMSSAYTGIGLVQTYIGDYKKAVESYFKGLEIKEKLGNKEGQAVLLSNIGELYMYQEQYNNSLDYHKRSLAIETEIHNEQGIAESYSNIAGVYFYLQQNDSSIFYYNRSIELSKKLGDDAGYSRSLHNIGCILTLQKKYKEAISILEESVTIREKLSDKNGIASSYQALGKAYQKIKKYKEAVDFTQRSLVICNIIDSKRTRLENYTQLAEIFKETKEFDKAIHYFQAGAALKDSIDNQEVSRSIVEIETKYETEKKEKEIKLLTQANKIQDLELNKNKIVIYSTVIVILLLIFLAATILRRYRLKKEANKIITEQKAIVEQKQKEILDSINYAKRIQYTLIAHKEFLDANLNDHFVYYRPKDIVSGDFYWATKKDERFYLAVCDSTGHGVPGAFMSLLNIGFLSEAINEKNIQRPNEILNYVRDRLIENISKEDQKDGFDGTVMCIDRKNNSITYSSAYNSPLLIKDLNITELPANKMPVGKGEKKESFDLFTIDATKGSMLYLFTDGFADQFGGPDGKKYKYKQLYNLLLSVSKDDTASQLQKLENEFEAWKGKLEQVDDVCIVGVRF